MKRFSGLGVRGVVEQRSVGGLHYRGFGWGRDLGLGLKIL